VNRSQWKKIKLKLIFHLNNYQLNCSTKSKLTKIVFFFCSIKNSVNEDTMAQLYFLYKELSLEALTILDKGILTKFVGNPSGISYFQVEGSGGYNQIGKKSSYICLSEMYCSCKNFVFSVVNKNENYLVIFKNSHSSVQTFAFHKDCKFFGEKTFCGERN
jgi:predicted nucleic acid-binding Zn finger protein